MKSGFRNTCGAFIFTALTIIVSHSLVCGEENSNREVCKDKSSSCCAKKENIKPPQFMWGRQVGTKEEDFGKSVAIDGAGNVYVGGWTSGELGDQPAGGRDALVMKLNASGDVIWKRLVGSAGDERIHELAVDNEGNSYIAGDTTGDLDGSNAGGNDIFIARLDAEGNQLWLRQIGTEGEDNGQYVQLDPQGNVWITGYTEGKLGEEHMGGKDVYLIKLDPKGAILKKIQFGTTGNDVGNTITFDFSGNIYVCGSYYRFWQDKDFIKMQAFVAKFNAGGDNVWVKDFGTDHFDFASGIQVNPDGSIYIGGSTGGEFGGKQLGQGDSFLAMLDKNGNFIWKRQFGTELWDGVLSLIPANDKSGDVIVSGCQNYAKCEGFCRRYDAAGNLKWVEEYCGQDKDGNGTCGKDVAMDKEGNYYHVGGTGGSIFTENSGASDAYIVKIREGDKKKDE